jgi:hypothetical protein
MFPISVPNICVQHLFQISVPNICSQYLFSTSLILRTVYSQFLLSTSVILRILPISQFPTLFKTCLPSLPSTMESSVPSHCQTKLLERFWSHMGQKIHRQLQGCISEDQSASRSRTTTSEKSTINKQI